MNELIFPAERTTEITFKVGIAGTSTTPARVSVVLERDEKSLSYSATRGSDDSWTANIVNPGLTFDAGELKMSISVLLNNHLFVPLKTTVCISELVPQSTPDNIADTSPLANVDTSTADSTTMQTITLTDIEKIFNAAETAVTLPTTVKREEFRDVKASILKTLEPRHKLQQSTTATPITTIAENTGSFFKIKKIRTVIK